MFFLSVWQFVVFYCVWGLCFPFFMVACFFHCVGCVCFSSRYGSLLFTIVYGVWVCSTNKLQTNTQHHEEETGKTNSHITSKDNQSKLTYLGYTMHHFDPYTSGDFLYHPVKLK